MIKQSITKNKVLIDPINQVDDFVVLTLKHIDYYGNVFHATSEYRSQNGFLFREVSVSFTKEEADQLFAMFQIPQGSFTEMYDNLASATMLAKLTQDRFFGLEASDWEDYIDPSTIPVEPGQEEMPA